MLSAKKCKRIQVEDMVRLKTQPRKLYTTAWYAMVGLELGETVFFFSCVSSTYTTVHVFWKGE